jgi:GTP-binding protein
MKITSVNFEVSAADAGSYPAPPLAEFAFIGRSNVGKSSLINLVAGRRDLARVSVTPGKTRLINFFLVNEAWRLVDLPGYGYAKAGKNERADFNEASADYLESRPNLLLTFVLIDSRLPPQRIDLDFINWLGSCHLDFALIFTKTDKQPAQVERNIHAFTRRLAEAGLEVPEVLVSSSTAPKGRAEILHCIGRVLAEAAPSGEGGR